LLRATLFKADLRRRFLPESTASDESGCRVANLVELIQHLTEVEQQLAFLLEDVSLAYPRERSQLRGVREKFHQVTQNLQKQSAQHGSVMMEESLRLQMAGLDPLCEVGSNNSPTNSSPSNGLPATSPPSNAQLSISPPSNSSASNIPPSATTAENPQ
jgi:hypothetical protein